MVEIEVSGVQRQFDIDDPALPDWIKDKAFSSDNYPYEKRLKRSQYEDELAALQLELVKLQAHQRESGLRIIIVFEGRDAAGKGGTINTFRTFLNARHARVVALSKPTDRERGEWYFQRYISHFPSDGEMVMFDRSWYNRAGVEPVMGFCSSEQHRLFLEQVPAFEKQIVDEGIMFFKIWLNIGQEMQLKRFHDRRHNPLKSWKLSPIDIKSLDKWDDYTNVRDRMMEATHNSVAPWTVVKTNDKRRGRLNTLRHVLGKLDYEGKDPKVIGKPDPKVLGIGPEFFGR